MATHDRCDRRAWQLALCAVLAVLASLVGQVVGQRVVLAPPRVVPSTASTPPGPALGQPQPVLESPSASDQPAGIMAPALLVPPAATSDTLPPIVRLGIAESQATDDVVQSVQNINVPAQQPEPLQEKQTKERKDDEILLIDIKTAPPSVADLYRFETENDLVARMRQEVKGKQPKYKFEFPGGIPTDLPPLPARAWPPSQTTIEPNYLCYGRLFFEDRNSERYGHACRPIQPLLSGGLFYLDLVRLPLNVLAHPLQVSECNIGLGLPGDSWRVNGFNYWRWK